MQLKAIKPVMALLPILAISLKTFAFHTPIVTDGDFGIACEGYTGTFTRADRVDKKHHGNKNPVNS
jgi:hypothetical protein